MWRPWFYIYRGTANSTEYHINHFSLPLVCSVCVCVWLSLKLPYIVLFQEPLAPHMHTRRV